MIGCVLVKCAVALFVNVYTKGLKAKGFYMLFNMKADRALLHSPFEFIGSPNMVVIWALVQIYFGIVQSTV